MDTPTNPDVPRPRQRSKAPSFADLAADITGSHSVYSDPPTLRWLDRRVGRAIRLGARWFVTTKAGTATAAALGAAATWLSQHLLHWMK